MKKRIYTIFFVINVMLTPLHSATQLASFGIGPTRLNELNNTILAQIGYEYIKPNGKSVTLRTGILQSKNQETNTKTGWMPIQISIGHYFKPVSNTRLYAAGTGSINFLSAPYDSPMFGYGIKGGILIRINERFNAFIEGTQTYINNSNINPMTVIVGIHNTDLPLTIIEKIKQNMAHPKLKKRTIKKTP